MFLFFDTETTGLPKNWKAPVTDLNNWPRMVQIAWILCDTKGNRIEANDYIIKPNGFIIPKDASNVHRITTDKANKEGAELEDVLCNFNSLVDKATYIVAHNISFDEKIIGAEFLRKKIKTNFSGRKKLCTMQASTNFCRIPGPYGFKWPKLSELHQKLFGADFEEAHDASADINATEKCFWEMRRLGLI
ncbi:3'-5' exonuclease [Saccharicrinis fermentans]|uniref:DNA polymerase III subunit epsilon n=1 Tax=Saccharicrinis fermentans DSM 9555 = JCM 21142 TaxID=869213 RepID=W7YGV2_9BACT|nr:3'-5' exonuclease [Saccharicrinis fermentans]GAF03621.1 DNA polymerase III subunit epsilon [Saccharicrinis fermentans DSM 9555 = JCM 21142]